jgi:ferredoxin
VEEIAGVGLDMILAALAYGAGEILVACGRQNPPSIRKAVAWQTRMANDILKGLDMGEDRVRFAVIPPEHNAEEEDLKTEDPGVRVPISPVAAFPPGHDKRALARLAAQHLYNESGVRQPRLPLPDGSPFGAVAVAAACTLCMACAAACPSGALSAGGDVPRLAFRESRCHQCGLCEEACPEGALHLTPRLLCDPEAVEAPAVLREAEPFCCVECGVPFASPALITRIQEKLTGHWMYASERQRRRLRMCRTCRTRDALTSQETTSWNR